MLDTITKRRVFNRRRVKQRVGGYRGLRERLQQLQQLERLEQFQQLEQLLQLQQLQQLEQLLQLQKLQLSAKSYDQVEIKPNSIVYCDPPYKNTAGYTVDFNFNKFYSWAEKAQFPLFISEYDINIPNFNCVFAINKRSLLTSNKAITNIKVEKIYANPLGQQLLKAYSKHSKIEL